MSGQSLAPRDLARALQRYNPVTTVWVIDQVRSLTQFAVSLDHPQGVVPVLGPSLLRDYVGARVYWLTGPLSGAPAGAGSPGRFSTTIQQITSTAGPPPQTVITLADMPPPPYPQAGDQLAIVREVSQQTILQVANAPGSTLTATIDTSGGPVEIQGNTTVINTLTSPANVQTVPQDRAIINNQGLAPASPYQVPNSADIVVTKAILSVLNTTGLTLSSGDYLGMTFSSEYVAWFGLGGLAPDGVYGPRELDFGGGINTGSGGIAVAWTSATTGASSTTLMWLTLVLIQPV